VFCSDKGPAEYLKDPVLYSLCVFGADKEPTMIPEGPGLM